VSLSIVGVFMLRKKLKVSVAGLCLLTAGLPLAGRAGASPKLISLVFSSSLQAPQQVGAERLRHQLMETVGNHFVVDERGGNSVGSENAILAATRAGSVDMAVLTASVVSSSVPALGVFDIPFLFRDAAHARAVAEGPAGAAIAAKFAEKGLVLLAIGKQGFRNLTNSKRPIREPADLKGLKIRVLPNPVYQMTFKALGAEVVPMEYPLVYAALKDGRIDGQENPLQTIASGHLQDVQKYLSLTSHFFSAILFVANREMFEKLDPADQALLIAAAKQGADATWRSGDDAEAKRLQLLRSEGMEVIDTINRQTFVDAVKPLDPEFEKLFGKDLLTAIRSTP
jgi:tripartite ATP-independent transporter DctP family solute receptor